MNFLKKIYFFSTSFDGYRDIVLENPRKAFFYFVGVVVLSGFLLYPITYHSEIKANFPALEELAVHFPSLEFKDYQLVNPSETDERVVIKDSAVGVVVDPEGSYRSEIPFSGFWLLFTKKSLLFHYQSQLFLQFQYHVLAESLKDEDELNFIKNGDGVLDGDFFIRLRDYLERKYWTSGIFFCLMMIAIAFVMSLFFSMLGYLYSSLTRAGLEWSAIRSISYYSMTPVVVFLTVMYLLNFNVVRLKPLFFTMYALFFIGAIHRLRPVNQDDENEEGGSWDGMF